MNDDLKKQLIEGYEREIKKAELHRTAKKIRKNGFSQIGKKTHFIEQNTPEKN